MKERCIAYHNATRLRCSHKVSTIRPLDTLKLCREHGRSVILVLDVLTLSQAERDELASRDWTVQS